MESSSEAEFDMNEEESEEESMGDEESEDDDVAISSLNKTANDDDDDIDSDVPLSSLKKSPKIAKKKAEAKKKPRKSTKKTIEKKKVKKEKTKESKTPVNSGSNSNAGYTTAAAALYGTECKKGLLIQRFLCRWWYHMQWPEQEKIPETTPPHYDAMDGFLGVYICTSGDNVGHILDTRDHSKCPNFVNLAKKPASELQEMLLNALEKQKQALIETEGPGTPTEKEINDTMKWAQKLKPAKVDEEAKKVLKASKLSLP